VLVVRAPSQVFNPTIPDEEIEDALARDPAKNRAEYLSEWRDDIASYLPRELIDAAVDRGVLVRPRETGKHYHAFVDAASGVTRREDVLAFYGDGATVTPLAFSATIKDMKALLHNA
jgi:hypothetical protein